MRLQYDSFEQGEVVEGSQGVHSGAVAELDTQAILDLGVLGKMVG